MIQSRSEGTETSRQFSFFSFCTGQISNAPLIVFRILFGVLLGWSVLRFMYYGWVAEHFIDPVFHFTYPGFHWVQVLPAAGMYAIHIGMLISALGIILGAFYRISALIHFVCFTYCGLLDVTYYLNHYYLVSLLCFLMIFLPANRRFSVDAWRKPDLHSNRLERWQLLILQFQIALVYFFAAWAKMQSTWLIEALPMRVWLPAKSDFPLAGALFLKEETAYFFSWAGMFYDATIVFFLCWKPTRWPAYAMVVFFHLLTWLLFPIGVFPWVMIACTTVFLGISFHEKILEKLERIVPKRSSPSPVFNPGIPSKRTWVWIPVFAYIAFQLFFPLRYVLYPGPLFWREEGYRFSWRVMLMEKSGAATFYVKNTQTGQKGVVHNPNFLNSQQEKQMAFQPDLILQYAHFLHDYYEKQGISNPAVYAEVWVTLNGRPSQLMIDTTVNLAEIPYSIQPKSFILPFRP